LGQSSNITLIGRQGFVETVVSQSEPYLYIYCIKATKGTI